MSAEDLLKNTSHSRGDLRAQGDAHLVEGGRELGAQVQQQHVHTLPLEQRARLLLLLGFRLGFLCRATHERRSTNLHAV